MINMDYLDLFRYVIVWINHGLNGLPMDYVF
jgi:hypothetical protein